MNAKINDGVSDPYNFAPLKVVSLDKETFWRMVDETTDGASNGENFEGLLMESGDSEEFYLERLLPSGVPEGEFWIDSASVEASIHSVEVDESGQYSFGIQTREPSDTKSSNVSHIKGFAVQVPNPSSHASEKFFDGMCQLEGTVFVVKPGEIFGFVYQYYGHPSKSDD